MMRVSSALLCIAILTLALGSPTLADDAPADVPGPGETPPPPAVVTETGDQVGAPTYASGESFRPVPYERPTVQDFDRSAGVVCNRSGCDPCAPIPCIPQDPCSRSRGYGGVLLQMYPGLGLGLELGWWFSRSKCVDWAAEIGLSYQDLASGFNGIETTQGGKWTGFRLGLKGSFLPLGNSHPTFRIGLGFQNESGNDPQDMDFGDIPGTRGQTNYFGGYFGIGWEWDLFNDNITTGPEVWGWYGFPDQGGEEAWTLTVGWHVLFNF